MKRNIKKFIPNNFRENYYFLNRLSRKIYFHLKVEFSIVLAKLKRKIKPIALPELEQGKINLHLGCGSVKHPKFVNVDGLPAPHIHFVRPINDLSCFKKESVDLIYASHCLEHFPHAQVHEVLSEWFRVLKEDGILRISVPDFDLLLNIYQNSGNNIDSIIYALMGGQDYKYNFHMTVFNKASLFILLKDIGFREVAEWQPGTCELTTFSDHSTCQFQVNDKNYSVSLNLQAVK